MSGFTREEKLAMIRDYHERNMSQKAICDKYGIATSTLRETLQRYRDGGAENVGIGRGAPGRKQNQYPGADGE